jgi:hypothetical protein
MGVGDLRTQGSEVTGLIGAGGSARGNSPDVEGYTASFNPSFSGGNLRAPLYKGPLVQ